MNHIYIEAILFVAVFTLMSVVSIVISSRQAKRYQKKHIKEESSEDEVDKKELRISELLKLVNRKLLTNEEFQLLKEAILKENIKL
jgi:energy-converting hydrogenase Eha subunit H